MSKSIIIIGAGIAGLAAGCYGQMNGYRTQIFELHNQPGGLCTAWDRKGYTFDGCIHYLFGTAPGQAFHHVWEELGALPACAVINHAELMRIVGADGRTLIVYCDPDQLEAHMKALSPIDARLIEDFVDGIRQLMDFDLAMLQEKPRALFDLNDWREFGLKVLPFALPLAKWGRISAQEFARRFRDPFLQQAVVQMFGWPEIPVMAGLSLLAYMHKQNAGFPVGGSLEFARAIERRYLELGGEIHYKANVERILVEADRAVGVRLYDDTEYRADYVISAADGRDTIFDMLGGKFVNRAIQQTYDGRLPIHAQIQVSLGVARDLSNEPHWTTYLLDKPVIIAGEERTALGVKHYCFDPSLAPPGKSVVIVALKSNYGYWARIYGHKLYDTEQNQVAELVIAQLEQRYPGIRQQIEVVDVTTPVSYERFTGNWLGSTCGWLLTNDTMTMMVQGMDKTLPGLHNFYLCGQWVEPGGSVPIVAMSGRNAIQLICHAEQQPFVATVPASTAISPLLPELVSQ